MNNEEAFEALAKKYTIDPATLSSDAREAIAEANRKRRAGEIAPPGTQLDDFPIGLDKNYNPFPSRPEKRPSSQSDDEE